MMRPTPAMPRQARAGNGNCAPVTCPRPRARGSTRLAAAALLVLSLAGCSLLHSGTERERSTIYAPDPRVQIDPAAPAANWQLSLSPPVGSRSIDSFRIAVRPTPNELQVYRGAAWAKTPTDMLQDALLRALEDSGKLPSIARQGAGVTSEYKLVLDLRRFEADYAGNAVPAATIEFNAKLIHGFDQSIVASRTFHHAEPAAGTDIDLVVDAFSRGLGTVAAQLGTWVLTEGDRHGRSRRPHVAQ